MYVHRVNNGKRVPQYTCSAYSKVPVGTLCQTQHRINADVVMELIKELLKAVAEYSQLNREEFLETVKKAQTSQQSSEITRLKSRLAEAKKRVQELEKLICRIYEDNILGKLPDERYAILDGQYSKEQKDLSAEIADMEAELSGYEELDEEPSYGGRKYLEKQDYIRMKQKEEIANQQETILMQIDKVNENRLELAKQSRYVRANEEIIQSQEEKIKQQDTEFANNSDRIFKQGDLIEEQREELKQLTVRIEDVETLLDEVSSEAYDKAVEKVAKEAMLATRRDDIRLAEDSKKWIQDPKHKASKREKDYAIKRLDGLIRKIETAMEKVVIRITKQLKQPEKKKAVVEEIKKEVKPSIRERLAQNVAKIQREEAERKQLNKGKSCSSDLEL